MASTLELPAAATTERGVHTDQQLLELFRQRHDDASFAELVERYRGLVMGTCRRIVRNAADAEDAFQATFLVLAKKANDLCWQTSIGGWLHETARRTALKLVERRSRAARRDRVAGEQRMEVAPAPSVEDVAAIVDDELSKLPDKFREPLALVLFEELSREETAERLGISPAAVKDRLERGREQLRSRLLARGVTASAAALTTWLSVGSASAAASASLIQATAPAAAAFASGQAMTGLVSASALSLAQGVLQMSALAKVKTVLVAGVSMFILAGVALAALVPAPGRFEKGLRGHIESVDVVGASQKIVVKLDEFDVLLSLDVAPDAKIFLAYEQGTLGVLGKGAYVSVRLGEDHRTVKEIHALGTTHEVKITAVDPSKGIVTGEIIDDDDDNAAPKKVEFAVAKDAIVTVGHLPARLGQLHAGLHARLELGKDGKTIHGIEGKVDDERKVGGAVKAVDAVKGVTLMCEKDEEQVELLIKIAPGAIIHLDGKAVEITAIPVGAGVEARLTPDGVSIESLVATTPAKDDD